MRGRTRIRSRRMTRRMGCTSICATHAPASEPCALAGSAASVASAATQPNRVSNSLPPAPAAVPTRTHLSISSPKTRELFFGAA